MHFIFPKNYNFKPKLLGFIDYSTAIIDTVIGFIIFFFTNLLFSSIDIKIYVFVSLFLPVLSFSLGVKNLTVQHRAARSPSSVLPQPQQC